MRALRDKARQRNYGHWSRSVWAQSRVRSPTVFPSPEKVESILGQYTSPVISLRHHLRTFTWLAVFAMLAFAATHLEHCALCCLAASPMGMPPATVAVVPVPDGAAFVAARFLAGSHTLFAWASAQARAPPALS